MSPQVAHISIARNERYVATDIASSLEIAQQALAVLAMTRETTHGQISRSEFDMAALQSLTTRGQIVLTSLTLAADTLKSNPVLTQSLLQALRDAQTIAIRAQIASVAYRDPSTDTSQSPAVVWEQVAHRAKELLNQYSATDAV